MRVAYICNRYPAISMTFVRREIEGLRRLGIVVKTLSIRPPLSGDLLSPEDREAARSTYSVLPPKPRLLRAHMLALATRPVSYARTLAFSLGLSSGGVRAGLWRVFYFAEAIAVWHRCRSENVRHIHSHFANVATDVAMLCAHFADRPNEQWSWSFTLHGPVEFYDVYRSQLSEKIARARFVICISDFARSQAMACSEETQWDKLHVVHCGLDPEQWRPPAAPSNAGVDVGVAANADADVPSSGVRVLCVGRLIALKGHAVLIEAVARLRADGLEVTATLVGDGAARGALEGLADRRAVADLIEFAGSVGQDRIRNYFARADVFCLPSFAEGVPVVLMEAMAMELPVVSSQIMGIPELVQDEVSGMLTPPGRADELAARLRRLAEGPELRAQLGRAGRAKVVAEYGIATSAERIASLMRRYCVAGPAADADASWASPGSPSFRTEPRDADPLIRLGPSSASATALPSTLPVDRLSASQSDSSSHDEMHSLAAQNAGPPPGSDVTEV
jgi:colanic acid/amylovoran biosynthesis glycosyltransferase